MERNSGRVVWVDNVKILACTLVVLGHFFQSMVKSSILPGTDLYRWFEQTVYGFHVQLFFICSGYLYQRNSRVDSVRAWKDNVLRKMIGLGVPYVTFSTVTWGLKTLFSDSVNNPVGGWRNTLFADPLPPYWYLYCLFFLFVITPTFRDKRAAYIGLAAAACLELISIFKGGGGIFVVSYVLMFEIWFVAGMCIRVFEIDSYLAKIPVIFGVVLAAAFIGCRVVNYVYGISLGKASICLNVMGCLAVLMIICRIWRSNVQNAFLGFIAKYTMPIFLMHTIFSAVLRSALFKMGITSAAVHVTLGLLISFAGPIAAAKVMSYFKGLDFLLYPNRYIKAKKKP